MKPLKVNLSTSRYRAMIGVGGIGTGRFVSLLGNHTLGREESRAVRFLDYRDYCKLHIIAHYVKVLLGPEFQTTLVGKVGDDEVGRQLMNEMTLTGLDVNTVAVEPGLPTMNAICFIYPDGSGGNLTTENSACSLVDVNFVSKAEPVFACYRGCGIALAAPEVPLAARRRLLELATEYGFLRFAAFVSAEMIEVVQSDFLSLVDILSVNLDEAAALADLAIETTPAEVVVEAAITVLLEYQPAVRVCVTAGKSGSWCWDGHNLIHFPAFQTAAVSTAGAGDAFLASLIVGTVAGLSLHNAQRLGSLVAALTVTSPHTIHPGVDQESLRLFAAKQAQALPAAVRRLLMEE